MKYQNVSKTVINRIADKSNIDYEIDICEELIYRGIVKDIQTFIKLAKSTK